MIRGAAIAGLLIVISGAALLSFGCGTEVVFVRPPDPWLEVQGPSPYPEAVWIPGYWRYKRGGWIWMPGDWGRPPRPGAVWVSGYWEPRRGGWAWIPGRWENR